MDKFLEAYKLPRLNQEKVGNLRRWITRSKRKIKRKKKKNSANKSSQPDDFTGEFHQAYKELHWLI